ncbi:DUF1566 domain-containing protein [Acinetobacter sp. SwsAc4]|jgi:hypothetical protein|uniref:Lcl domain-containing protein n=1 Tax=Acinetobacter sp. SwsAc4 TaxID=2749437 RepID=UPI0015BA7CC9|nr:DUF1566 domain-containing protein [Acinetobacter sp. SwsAc4]NWK82696.1 DUF1566 domain-containing protein [Acinetobacter sp. SwsAc4]
MKNNSLSDFFSSSAELAAIEHFLHLIAKTNTFDQKLDVLQEQLRQSEQLQKKSEQQMAQNKQQYQQEINKLTQKHNEQLNKKIADLERKESTYQQDIKNLKQQFSVEIADLENKHHQEIEQLKQKIKQQVENTKTANVLTSQHPKTQIIHSNNELEQGVWTDPKTGLMWARINIGQEWKNGQCIGEAKSLNWEDAQKACKDFRLAGYSSWRLPTLDELKTLKLEKEAGYNCPQGILFKPRKYEWGEYWSSSLYACDYTNSYSIYSIKNSYSIYSNKNNKYYVRAVRSGQ